MTRRKIILACLVCMLLPVSLLISSRFAESVWVPTDGPEVGRVMALAIDPINAQTIYAEHGAMGCSSPPTKIAGQRMVPYLTLT